MLFTLPLSPLAGGHGEEAVYKEAAQSSGHSAEEIRLRLGEVRATAHREWKGQSRDKDSYTVDREIFKFASVPCDNEN